MLYWDCIVFLGFVRVKEVRGFFTDFVVISGREYFFVFILSFVRRGCSGDLKGFVEG